MQESTGIIYNKILLFGGFSNLCLANTVEPLRAANNLLGRKFYHWEISTLSGSDVRSSSGLSIKPDDPNDIAADHQRLFLISSYGYDQLFSPKLGRYLRNHLYNGGEVFGLDTGAWLMAEAGLLKEKSATIHWDVISRFEECFLDVNVENRPFIRDGKLISCGGAMSAFDLMLDQIAIDSGTKLRFDVQSLFKRSGPMAFDASEDSSAFALTRKAIVIMRDNLEAPLKITSIADMLNCHPKTLERAFKREMHMPAGQIYKRLRLNSIRDLVENTNVSFADIAVRTGYKSASAMTRAFTSEFGYVPSKIRKGR